MYWGNSLLIFGFSGWSDFGRWIKDGFGSLVYTIGNLIFSLLYFIWKVLAGIVGSIEKIFRSLAGVDSEPGEDLVSKVINHDIVQGIFKNLVAISMVIIVFFTIIKILQDHYKEKDGGNPYKVVISTFKGLLMFSFVGIAVVVGLQATGVFFRGLDAATGNTSSSLAGTVFTAMASEANRQRRGEDTSGDLMAGAANKYWARTSKDGELDYGKYVMLEMTGDSSIKTQADLQRAYLELCPEYKYGIVGSDGKVTPINSTIVASAFEDDVTDAWEDFYTGNGEKIEYDNDTDFSDGSGEVTAGYKNDILKAVGLNIRPTIDLTWSPVDIRTYYYKLNQLQVTKKKDWSPSYMGTTLFTLTFSIVDLKYVTNGGPINKSMEESAKMFGFTINGGLGLQDGTVSASFKFDMFKPDTFMDLLGSVIVNFAFTELTRLILDKIPEFPGQININAFPINLVQLLSGLVLACVEAVMNESLEKLVPKKRDADGKYTEEPMAKAFTYATSKYNSGGSWVFVNNKSDDLSVQVEQYYADGNFSDLWSQLVDNWNDFTKQLNQATDDTWETYNEKEAALEAEKDKIQRQEGWITYKSIVDQYNERALGYLNQIGKLLNLYDLAMARAGLEDGDYEEEKSKKAVNEALLELGYTGNIDHLQSAIKEDFTEFYDYYNNTVGSKANLKPGNTKADTIYAQSIYKPIVDLNFTKATVAAMKIPEIKKAFTTSNRNIQANVFVEEKNGEHNVIRQIDWSSYGPKFKREFSETLAEVYFTEEADAEANPVNENKPTLKNSLNEIVYFIADGDTSSEWQSYNGLNYYFVGDGPFINYEGKSSQSGATDIYISPGYWGERGLTVMGDRYYVAYDSSAEVRDEKNAWKGVKPNDGSSSASSLSTRSSSSPQLRSALEASKLETKNIISTLTDVSEEKSELAKEFAKNIITFRPLGDPTTENDIKVLNKWVEKQNKASVNAPHKAYAVQEMTPDKIDSLMATGDGQRRYLMLTKDGYSGVDAGGNYKSFIGMFSYTDTDTVKALYELAEINYAVGLISIISAAGVYLNFIFGLIQRAVNMAVLYVMSPISISFFPFDDGAKFKQQFVTPFYKEAISAFAVLLSLNIFSLLLDPVSEAVKEVLGGGIIGTTMSWLSLVAMVSMLPKVRETIQGVLGAGGLAQKGLGQMFNDAGKALGVDSVKKAKKNLANMRDKIREAKTAKELKKQAKDVADKDNLEKKLKKGDKLNAFERHRLKQLQGKEERDKKMKDALKKGSKENLSFTEKRRFDRLQKAAAKEAGNLKRRKGESDKAYAKRVEAAKQKLLANEDFRKKNGGNAVVKTASKIWNSDVGKSVRSGVAKTVGGLGKAGKFVTAPGRFIANSLWGEGTLLGELINNKKEALTEDKNSLIGSFLRGKDPRVKNKLRKQILDKEITKQKELADPLTDLTAGIEMLARKDIEKDKQVNELARKKLVKKKVGKAKPEEKLIDLLTAEEIERAEANGEKISFHDAREKAKQIAKKNIEATSLEEAYNLAGGDTKYVNGVVNGVKGFENFTTVPPINWEDDSIKNQLNKIESDLQKRLANGTVSLKAELEQISTKQDTTVKDFKEVMHSELHFDNEADKKAFDKVIDNCRNDPTMTFDKLLDKCVDILGSGKKASLEDALTKHQVMSVIHNDEISELKALLAASQAADKGKEMFLGKIGDFVSDADKEKIADAFRAARDTSVASTNPNSIGYRIEHEVNQNSNLSDAEKAKRREEITYEVKANAEAVLKDFRAKYEDDMREYSAAKKYREASSAVEAVAMISELQNQRDYHMNVNMQVPDIQMIVNDGLIQKLHESGDYAGAGYKLQELVTAIKQHDDAKAIQLGFDEATIEKMKKLESSGQIARLKSIQELGEFDAAYMGNISDSMGGSGLAGMEAAFAQLTRVAESKTIAEKFKVAADDFAHREAQNRAIVEQTLKKIESTMTGSAWEKLAENMGVDISKLSSTLTDAISGVNKGTHSMADVKSVIDAVTAYRNINLEKPAIVETLDMVLGGFSSANLANEQCDQTNALRSKLSDVEGSLQDIMKKLKPLLGGK